jgi:hypothetical protein
MLSADHRSFPFDWCITTRDFVLQTLGTLDASGFTPPLEQLEQYEMPLEKTQGVGKDGVWLWHDFPRNGHELHPDWRQKTNYLTKYPFLWERFLSTIRDPSRRKTFIISNSQDNLEEFAGSEHDFAGKFGLSANYLHTVHDLLENAGAENYEFVVLSRKMGDYLDIINKCELENLDPRFVGPLSLPFHSVVANSILQTGDQNSDFRNILGEYENGNHIVEAPFNSVLVTDKDGRTIGAAKHFHEGFIFSFDGGKDHVARAVEDEGTIHFSNKWKWKKTG